MSLHQLSGRIRWRIWARGRGWIWRIRAAVGIGRSRSCRCWSTDVVRLEGEGNDRLLPSFKQTPAFYSIYDAPSFLSLFFFSSFHPQKSGGRETKRILSSLFVLFSLQPFRFLSLYLFSFRDIDNPEGVKITGDPSIPYKWGLIIDKVGNERKQFARSEDGEDRKLLAAG